MADSKKQFPKLKNDTLLRAARGEEVDRIPVWIMRQAGRYLPEFREVREKHDFFTICETPTLAAEISLQPVRRYDLDACIIFSDILVIPKALGMNVEMKPGVGPVVDKLTHPDDIEKVRDTSKVTEKLSYVAEAITLTRHKLEGKVPLIGFSGAPWTLMGYMVEGSGSRTMSEAKGWLYKYPSESKKLLDILTDAVVEYLIMQVEAGAQLLQVFESSAEHLGPELFHEFALPCIHDISRRVKSGIAVKSLEPVPMTIFAKGAHYALEDLGSSGYDVVGIDWTVDPLVARKRVGDAVTLQGNMDPCALYAPQEKLKSIVTNMIKKFGKSKYIANLGHGIYPDVNPDQVQLLVNTIHSVK